MHRGQRLKRIGAKSRRITRLWVANNHQEGGTDSRAAAACFKSLTLKLLCQTLKNVISVTCGVMSDLMEGEQVINLTSDRHKHMCEHEFKNP